MTNFMGDLLQLEKQAVKPIGPLGKTPIWPSDAKGGPSGQTEALQAPKGRANSEPCSVAPAAWLREAPKDK